MVIRTLLTQNGLELPCVVLPIHRQLFPIGKEVMVYCQNRLCKGYVEDEDDEYIAEIEVSVEYLTIPEYDNELQSLDQRSELFF